GLHRPLLALEARLRARFETWRRPRWIAARLAELAGELERACVDAPAALVAWQAARWLERRSARHLVGVFAGVARRGGGGRAAPALDRGAPRRARRGARASVRRCAGRARRMAGGALARAAIGAPPRRVLRRRRSPGSERRGVADRRVAGALLRRAHRQSREPRA